MNKIGENIRIAREKAGITQDELAQKLGYKSRSSITKIESGEHDIPRKKVIHIAKALNISLPLLMGYDDETPTIEEVRKMNEQRYLVTADEERKLLWEHTKMLAEEAKKNHNADELEKLTNAICTAVLALSNL